MNIYEKCPVLGGCEKAEWIYDVLSLIVEPLVGHDPNKPYYDYWIIQKA